MIDGSASSELLGIDESNLRIRREFIGLDEDDQALLGELVSWAQEVAPSLARRFYDYQFTFGPTLRFFESYARASGQSLDDLRSSLEAAMTGYVGGVFAGAAAGWDLDYFQQRLHVGSVHDRINLPFKWYIGSYCTWTDLIREALLARNAEIEAVSETDQAGTETLVDVEAVMRAVGRVFNLDIQAVSDSFLMGTLQSLGLSVAAIQPEPGQDRTEGVAQIKSDIEVLLAQAASLASDTMDSDLLRQRVDGSIGESFSAVAAKIQTVAGSISEVSTNVTTVAAAIEELSVSSQEVSQRSSEVVTMSDQAVELANAASGAVSQLTESSDRIDQVTGAISRVADQTNLLALNATIEAARAGEAGKGFAVVAEEVKNLARQTASSTTDIETQINDIRTHVNVAVESITAIVESIANVNGAQSSIAAAVEEQAAAVSEVGHSISSASIAANEISALVQLD